MALLSLVAGIVLTFALPEAFPAIEPLSEQEATILQQVESTAVNEKDPKAVRAHSEPPEFAAADLSSCKKAPLMPTRFNRS